MRSTIPRRNPARLGTWLTYGALILIVPALGFLAALIAAWHALLAGSIWYMPLGLLLLLTAAALIESHKLFDLALLGLVTAGFVVVFRMEPLQQNRLSDAFMGFALQTGLLVSVVFLVLVILIWLRSIRQKRGW